MYQSAYTAQFKKDLKKSRLRNLDISLLKDVLQKLIKEETLPPKYKDHKLLGKYKGREECHIKPDLLLIYKIDGNTIIFERLGKHSDLFY